jgi:hypothetical protein
MVMLPSDPQPQDNSPLVTAPQNRQARLVFVGILVALATVASAAQLGLINLNLSPDTASQFVLAQAQAVASAAQVGLINPAPDSTNRILLAQAQAWSCEHEYRVVQDGLLAYMASNNVTTVAPSSGTSDMTSPLLLYIRGATTTNPSYVPYPQTEWMWGWDFKGKIHSMSLKPGGPDIPPRCPSWLP